MNRKDLCARYRVKNGVPFVNWTFVEKYPGLSLEQHRIQAGNQLAKDGIPPKYECIMLRKSPESYGYDVYVAVPLLDKAGFTIVPSAYGFG